MAVRKVELRLTTTGFAEAGAELDKLNLKLDKLKEKLDAISRKVITPRVDIGGLDAADAKADDFLLKLDRIGAKRVTAHVSMNVDKHGLRNAAMGAGGTLLKDAEKGIGGVAGGASSGASSGILSSIGGANNQYTGGLIAALVAMAASIAPAILPFALGGGIGGGAALGALALGKGPAQKILALQQQLQTASPKTRPILQQRIDTLRDQNGPLLDAYGAFSHLGHAAKDTFMGALSSNESRPHGGQVPNTSFLSGLAGILKQVSGFVKSIGPGLGQMFRASLPFLAAFVKIGEQFAKALMPAITQSLKQLTPYIPQIVKGFLSLSQGIAGMIKALGPGMKPAVTVFKALMIGVKGILIGIGYAADALAIYFARAGHNIGHVSAVLRNDFDEVRHTVAKDFDSIRHYIMTDLHDIAHTFDSFRHTVSSIWDEMWSRTVGQVIRGIHDVEHWFSTLPPNIVSKLASLAGKLFTVGVDALQGLLNGFIHMGPTILGWVGSFVSSIPGTFMKLLHMGSPSKVMAQIGRWTMQGLLNGLTSTQGQVKSTIASLANIIKGDFKKGLLGAGQESFLTHLLHRDNGRLQQLAYQRSKIISTIKAAEAYRKSTKDNILNAFSITSATNLTGNPIDAGGVMQELKLDLSQVKAFATNIKKLVKMGLNHRLLRQIIAAGPVDGAAVAQALADASPASIRNINSEENQIIDQSRRVSYIAADGLYDAGKHAGKGFLTGLKAQEHNIEKLMRRIARSLVNAIKKELRIHSPSMVMHDLGLQIGLGLMSGMDTSLNGVKMSAGRLAKGIPASFGNIHVPGGAGMVPGGGGVATLTVKGEGDDLVKAIVKALRYDIKHNGGGNVQQYLGWGSR